MSKLAIGKKKPGASPAPPKAPKGGSGAAGNMKGKVAVVHPTISGAQERLGMLNTVGGNVSKRKKKAVNQGAAIKTRK